MVVKYFKEYISLINEGLIKTYNPNIVLSNTLKLLKNSNINGSLSKSNGNDKIIIEITNFNKFTFEMITDIFNILSDSIVKQGGFFISIIEIENLHKNKNSIKTDIYEIIPNKNYYLKVKLIFESKFEKVESNRPNKLYHLSIKEYESKILKYGLIPKEKSKLTQHPDRIYLCKSIEDCKELINKMKIHYEMERDYNMYSLLKKKWTKNTNPIIFEIDNSDDFIKNLYKDPNYVKGYFTIDNIPPNKIKII
jgi:hypothetical protein